MHAYMRAGEHAYLDLLRVRNFCALAKLQKLVPFQQISAVSIKNCRLANFLRFPSMLTELYYIPS